MVSLLTLQTSLSVADVNNNKSRVYLFVCLFVRVVLSIMMGGFVLGQVSALSPDYEKAKVAAARLFKIFDRKSAIDSSSENGLRPVRIFSICADYTDYCEATAEENKTRLTTIPLVQLYPNHRHCALSPSK